MARQRINDIELYYELTGDGDDTVVLVHGGWTDHLSWQLVAPALAERHRVLSYDRRGHSRSDRPPTPASRRLDEDDLAALIETLDLGPVHLVGNSYGGSISLGLAARRPDLARSVTAHEPPLLGISRSYAPLTAELSHVSSLIDHVGELLRGGDLAGGAQYFIDVVALGPGTWQLLPDENRHTFVANAATFLDTIGDPHWSDVPEPDALPVLLTDGGGSPTWLPATVAALAATTYRHASRHTFVGAGHVPHLTHPDDYVAVVDSFIVATSARTPTRSLADNGADGVLVGPRATRARFSHTVGADPTSSSQRRPSGGTNERTPHMATAAATTTTTATTTSTTTTPPRNPPTEATTDLYVEVWGHGTPVVLVHGSLANGADEWAAQRPLADDGFRLIVPDRRGCGRSPAADGEDFLVDADDLGNLMSTGAHLVGHSYGGLSAMIAAARWPEATLSLTLLEGPAASVAPHDPAWRTLVADVRRMWQSDLADEDWAVEFLKAVGSDPAEFPADFLATAVELVPVFRRGRPFHAADLPLDRLAAAAFPKLVVSGGHHPGFEAMSDDLAVRIGATRVVIAGAGHEIQFTGPLLNDALRTLWSATS